MSHDTVPSTRKEPTRRPPGAGDRRHPRRHQVSAPDRRRRRTTAHAHQPPDSTRPQRRRWCMWSARSATPSSAPSRSPCACAAGTRTGTAQLADPGLGPAGGGLVRTVDDPLLPRCPGRGPAARHPAPGQFRGSRLHRCGVHGGPPARHHPRPPRGDAPRLRSRSWSRHPGTHRRLRTGLFGITDLSKALPRVGWAINAAVAEWIIRRPAVRRPPRAGRAGQARATLAR